MKPNYIILALAFTLILGACNSSNKNNSDEELDKSDSLETNLNDSALVENSEKDTTDTVENYVKDENPDVEEAKREIVKKFGIQWDFCTCINKSDSVNTALMEASDDAFDMVMERSEYIDSKCKEMLVRPNATPEDRLKHDKKVKNCLSKK
ncbi:MAG: hypothetical protein WED10_11765 [Brumimicrobium sp.]